MAALRSLTMPVSPFRYYYQGLVQKGLRKMSALVAVMRKMLRLAYRLLKDGSVYDPQKISPALAPPAPPPRSAVQAA
jgi:hypothetical protein